MGNQNYKLYRSGIHLADIYFQDIEIFHSKRDIFNNNWSEINTYDKEENIYKDKYNIDIVEIQRNLEKYNRLIFTNFNEYSFNEDIIYQKKSRDELSYFENKEDVIVWAQRKKRYPMDIILYKNEVVGFIVTNREECIVLVKDGYEEYTPQDLWEKAKISKDEFRVKKLEDYMVSMRDGVKLATEVWIPETKENNTKFPTVFIRTPYGKDRISESQLRFVQRGYVLVIQDVRGREKSQGEFSSKGSERLDGDDSLNWISQQSWCDGNIGMYGASYLGYVQWAAASTGNPHLKAIVSIVTAGSPFGDLPRKGGTMASGILAWIFAMSKKNFYPEAMERDDWDQIVKIRPIKDIPEKILGKPILFWDNYMNHSLYDEFWELMDWSKQGDKINVPSLIISGWFDDNGQGSLEAWSVNAKYNRENMKMILGPWLHKANTNRDIGDIGFGNNAIRYDIDLAFQKWFDRYLKNIDTGIDKEAAVDYYVQGSNKWKDSNTWTPEKAERKNLYLDSLGQANSSKGDGKLRWEKKFNHDYDEYSYDPYDPTPHLIDLRENELNVPANYRDIEKRKDVLVYTSDVLEEEVTIAGEVFTDIYAETSAKDTDWVVRLTDLDMEGNSRRLVDGVYRAKYIDDFKKEALLSKGEIRKYRINMFHTSNTFKKGHMIRVEITSSAENLVFPNQNTGNDFSTDTEYVIAQQRIYHSKEYPSKISIPVIDY
ncbi:CocE/NonD family hydrolase [Gudongella sp. DL1XJH-153]|uniref:CocE/NonD family hydrolase n=1 Tax=Gudongella sp. DL1XJH-153 TaxID=3409804 RepID=UPI003BB59D19